MACRDLARSTLIALFQLCLFIACSQVPAFTTALSLETDMICNNLQGLVSKQRAICNTRPDAMVVIGDGAEMSSKECQWQFKGHRWNCSLVGHMNSLELGKDLQIGSREAGFAYSIKSAGIAFYLTQGCSTGAMKGCGCDKSKADGAWSSKGWKWGGCSADIGYGIEFSRIFVDASETERKPRALMNLHNNRAGRKLLKNLLVTDCKCHGPSGSCTLKTCWISLPSFRTVGTELMRRYHKAKRVEPVQLRKKEQKQVSLKLLRRKRSDKEEGKRPRKGDLVFLENSPNYCDANASKGVLGTEGRHCSKTSTGSDSCHQMCCGRGYNTHEYKKTWQCDCKFHWCCHVTCNECYEDTEIYSCK